MYCKWLNDEKDKQLKCWQTGSSLRKSECAPCLLARLVQAVTSLQARKKATK
ncbi:unnamed protein product [marine sediment metagenome]|uniref:Uncharacterized protein n=1 Tax=marine sediment metagenome TaxID=412755 RepID=X1KEN7_9ZZZZ